MISSHDGAGEQQKQQQRSLLSDGDQLINARRRSGDSGDNASDIDVENDYSHSLDGEPKGVYPASTRRRRSRSVWSLTWGKLHLQCPPQLNRRHKLLFVSLTILALLAGCAALYSKKHGMLLKPPPPPVEEKPPPPPKPTFCSTWPVNKQAREVESLEQRAPVVVDRAVMDKRYEANKGKWKKPSGFKIIATVFYGRKRNTDVLDCYLQRNLARNGGYLDEIRFMVHTDDEADRAWLEKKVSETEGYTFVDLGDCTHMRYGCIWEFIAEEDTLFIKIDDDIVYIHEDAIPRLVQTRLEQPNAFAVSANLVNSPLTGYLHFHFGAVHPYLPDPATSPNYPVSQKAWRVLDLPYYAGNKSFKLDVEAMDAPYLGHRWLPVSHNDTNMDGMVTPMGMVDNYGGTRYGLALKSWAVATQHHYSLFQNLESDTMWKYHFGGRFPPSESLWNMQFTRYNLNFIAIWGRDVRANLPIQDDDEQGIGVDLPKKLGRPFFVDTKAIVAHLHFGPQTLGVLKTDVLDRYRAYANEMVCAADNQKAPLDERCAWVHDMEVDDW